LGLVLGCRKSSSSLFFFLFLFFLGLRNWTPIHLPGAGAVVYCMTGLADAGGKWLQKVLWQRERLFFSLFFLFF
jgi:hypothetical protein